MAEILMTNTIKDDESMLPGIYPSEREHQLSSIFIEADTPLVNHFPFQILSLLHMQFCWLSHLNNLLDMQGRYGTRSTCALSVKSSGEVNFYERYLDKDQWKEHTMSYQIKKMEVHG